MPAFPLLQLRPLSEAHVKNRHHAIFRSAVGAPPQAPDGAIVEVRSSKGEFLCYAHWNSQAYICGRVLSFREGDPLAEIRSLLERAVALRKNLFTAEDTTAYRLINAEGDSLPGLIVDKYDTVLVVQCTTLGFDLMREWVAQQLWELCAPSAIYEKSTSTARKKEGMGPREGWLRPASSGSGAGLRGEGSTVVPVTERGIRFSIQLAGSQKTGLFLDQREMRAVVRSFAKDRTVLDCCSYVGGFSVAALLGGARHAHAVDYDPQAIEGARANVAENGIEAACFNASAEDVFNFLRRRPLPQQFDFIIVDPPAFAKRSSDIDQATKAYTDLNRLALEALPAGSLLLTCSCSFHVNAAQFQTIVFHAARQAGRSVRILQRHRQAYDHPINLYHPEVDYLKSLLLWVE